MVKPAEIIRFEEVAARCSKIF